MTHSNKDSAGTAAEPSVFTEAEAKSIATVAVALMMSGSSVSRDDLRDHFIGLLDAFKAAREALRPFAEIGTSPDRSFDYYTPAARFQYEFTHPQVAAARKAMGWDR